MLSGLTLTYHSIYLMHFGMVHKSESGKGQDTQKMYNSERDKSQFVIVIYIPAEPTIWYLETLFLSWLFRSQVAASSRRHQKTCITINTKLHSPVQSNSPPPKAWLREDKEEKVKCTQAQLPSTAECPLCLLAKQPVLALGSQRLSRRIVHGLLVAGLAGQFLGGLVVLEDVSGAASAGVLGAVAGTSGNTIA